MTFDLYLRIFLPMCRINFDIRGKKSNFQLNIFKSNPTPRDRNVPVFLFIYKGIQKHCLVHTKRTFPVSERDKSISAGCRHRSHEITRTRMTTGAFHIHLFYTTTPLMTMSDGITRTASTDNTVNVDDIARYAGIS